MSDISTTADDERSFLTAAFTGDLEAVKSALASGTTVDAAGRDFYKMGMHQNVTALMCAADQGHLEIVQFLLAAGANVAAITELSKSEGGPGTQALHFAARSGHEAIVAALLDAGADINAQNAAGRTPLLSALAGSKLNCATLLLERGATASFQSKRKDFEHPLVVLSRVLSNTVSMVTRNGRLQCEAEALWDEKEHVLRLYQQLLRAGADPNKTDRFENRPLNFLTERVPDDVRLPIVELLLEHGALADAVKTNGYSILMRAADYHAVRMAELLFHRGVEINRVSISGTALDIAICTLETLERNQSHNVEAITSAKAMVSLLQQHGGLRESELSDIPTPTSVPPEPVHVATDFLKLVNTTEAEWALLAVKAPFEAALEPYQKFAKLKKRQQYAPIRISANGEEVPRVTAIIQVKGSPWTIILCSIFYVRQDHLKHIKGAAEELSRALATRVVTYAGTADTEYGRCELFENGESASRAGSAKAIAFLTKEAIPLPACYPAKNDTETWLAIEKVSQEMVERADLLSK